MADRVHPSSTKPNPTTTPTLATAMANTQPSPTKTHLPSPPTRHPYRPNPNIPHYRHKHGRREFTCRRCFCLACFWTLIILVAVTLLAAIAGAAFNVLYHPMKPAFSVTSLRITSLDIATAPLDGTTHLTTNLTATLSAKNPNKKITFYYDPASLTVLTSHSVILSNTSCANFTSPPGNISVIHATMGVKSQLLDADSVNSLKSDLKRRNGLALEIVMDTMVGVKMEKIKMKKVGIRVKCGHIRAAVRGKTVISNTAKAKCEVDLRFNILKRSFW